MGAVIAFPGTEPKLTEVDARLLTESIKAGLEHVWGLVVRAYTERAWETLGYASWDSYCGAEFGNVRLRLPREDQQAAIKSLREAGLSTRAIASATGVSRETVRRDSGDTNGSPGPVTGRDGKTYKPKPKPKPKDERPQAEPRAKVHIPDNIGDAARELNRLDVAIEDHRGELFSGSLQLLKGALSVLMARVDDLNRDQLDQLHRLLDDASCEFYIDFSEQVWEWAVTTDIGDDIDDDELERVVAEVLADKDLTRSNMEHKCLAALERVRAP